MRSRGAWAAARCTCRSSTAAAGSSRAPARWALGCCRGRAGAARARPPAGLRRRDQPGTRSVCTPRRSRSGGAGRRRCGDRRGHDQRTEDTLDATRAASSSPPWGRPLLGAALAALLTGRALRPLRRLPSAARATSSAPATRGRRLPETAVDDEVGDLARRSTRCSASLERAREAERRFVGDASHELRTPMTALRGNAAYLARHGARRLVADFRRTSTGSAAARRPARAQPRGRRGAARRRASPLDRRRPPIAGTRRSRSTAGDRRARGERAGARAGDRQPGAQRATARPAGRRDPRDGAAGGGPRSSPSATRARASTRPTGSGRSSASGAAPAPAPGRASASRSCGRSPSATAAGRSSTAPRFTIDLPGSQRTLQLRCYTGSRNSPRKDRHEVPAHTPHLPSARSRWLWSSRSCVAAAAGRGRRQRRRRPDAAAEAARTGPPRRPRRPAGRRGHRARDLHEQALSVRSARRERRPGADVGRIGSAVADERRARADRAAVERSATRRSSGARPRRPSTMPPPTPSTGRPCRRRGRATRGRRTRRRRWPRSPIC